MTFEDLIPFVSGLKLPRWTRITARSGFVSRPCLPPHPSDLAELCKYQQRASCLLCFSKASATSLTFIYICCQRITFLSYERLSRPACLNVVTHKFITRPLGTRLKGPICDPNVNKRVTPHQPQIFKNTGFDSTITRLTTSIFMLLKDQLLKEHIFTLSLSGDFGTK